MLFLVRGLHMVSFADLSISIIIITYILIDASERKRTLIMRAHLCARADKQMLRLSLSTAVGV